MASRYRTAGKTASTGFNPSQGLWHAHVERVDGAQIWVTIPRLVGESIIGPIPLLGREAPIEGDTVLIGFLEGRLEDPVILGIVVPEDGTTYDFSALTGRISDLEATDIVHGQAINTLEQDVDDLEQDVDDLEGDVQALEGTVGGHETRIQALEVGGGTAGVAANLSDLEVLHWMNH